MKTKILILVFALAVFLAAAGIALADVSLELPRWVISGGATVADSGGIHLNATLGQPVVGVVSNAEVTLGQGFWVGGSSYAIYLPIINK